VEGEGIKLLQSRQLLRLQGFPNDWLAGLGILELAAVRMVGNSMSPPMSRNIISCEIAGSTLLLSFPGSQVKCRKQRTNVFHCPAKETNGKPKLELFLLVQVW
jgi:hypothetical protein